MTGTDHMQFDGDLMTFNMFIASVCIYMCVCVCVCVCIQGVTGGTDQTLGGCSLC